jgi:putative ATPase
VRPYNRIVDLFEPRDPGSADPGIASRRAPRTPGRDPHSGRPAGLAAPAVTHGAEPAPPLSDAPLADRMRPRTLDEVVGQDHLIAPGKVLRRAAESGDLHSMILWGPPGSGKTTLAALLAGVARARFVAFSAVLSGVKEIRAVVSDAETAHRERGARTVLFVDEIHRFNRAQQDAFLPHVERGTIVLVGATTENPSFEVNAALLSRCRVYVLRPLAEPDLVAILRRALDDAERGLAGLGPAATEAGLRQIAVLANGDARSALNILELAVVLTSPGPDGTRAVTDDAILGAAQRRALLYDKSGEEHYNLISALHKSLRDSDPDASLYWLARMLESGEDPLYLARRLVRFASEDIGNADPAALTLAIAARDAYELLGSPEGDLALAQTAAYLAVAPKSNAVYVAFGEALEDVRARPAEPVPLHIRNAPTALMKTLGYGQGYRYAHDAPDARVDQEHLPESLRGRQYYRPTDRGGEAEIGRRLAEWRRWRAGQAAARPSTGPRDAGPDA